MSNRQHNIQYWADVVFATAAGAGLCPIAPGTMGAAAGVSLWWIATLCLDFSLVQWITLAATVAITLLSISPINRLERVWGKDPSRVVIDEVAGVWICLLAVPSPTSWGFIFAAFALFRLFDIVKPFGIRRLEDIDGGWGVMLDDIAAGLLGYILLLFFQTLFITYA